ncbi:MAG: TIGR03621 family F420-dependent LLM class oxidoreductase [Chloroflexi bacterium]|nr:TIGR03621 family F420-dependent LLM class oxidoreductase [Chloroflexota bacterium]MBV9599115.1 TIGR03621 family F420-dependent LLM class oxidoreductase [Chloroflexota bacterium]
MARPFRFIAPVPPLNQPVARWRDALQRIEDLGFSSVSISDHFTRGWVMEPTVAMLAAAEATRHLRVLSLVLANDYRHPVLLHKAAATIDVFSEGRLELGLGTGWLASEYAAAGFPFDAPGERVARLEESIHVLKGLFGSDAFSFEGAHYRIQHLDGLPKPVQQPHPPLLIGGGSRRVLELAAREADIVSVHGSLREGELGPAAATDLAGDRVAAKVSWVRAAAERANRLDDIELQFSVYMCHVTDSVSQRAAATSSFAGLLEADPRLLAESPAVLCGSVEQCVDLLQERRERYGFSYLKLSADVQAVAPIVARLTGT